MVSKFVHFEIQQRKYISFSVLEGAWSINKIILYQHSRQVEYTSWSGSRLPHGDLDGVTNTPLVREDSEELVTVNDGVDCVPV